MRKNLHILLTAVWVIVIFSHSLQTGLQSSQTSGLFTSLIYDFLTWLSISVDPSNLGIVVRKIGHIVEFFILGILLIRTYQVFEFGPIRSVIYAIATGLLVGVVDETTQLFVEGRAGTVADVGIDMIGVILGVGLILLIQKIKDK